MKLTILIILFITIGQDNYTDKKAFKFKIPLKGKNSKDHTRAKPLLPDGVQRIKNLDQAMQNLPMVG